MTHFCYALMSLGAVKREALIYTKCETFGLNFAWGRIVSLPAQDVLLIKKMSPSGKNLKSEFECFSNFHKRDIILESTPGWWFWFAFKYSNLETNIDSKQTKTQTSTTQTLGIPVTISPHCSMLLFHNSLLEFL